MIYLLAGVTILLIAVYALKAFSQANPAVLARLLKQGGGFAALAAALVLMLRGRFEFAIALGGLGFWLLGMGMRPYWTPFRSTGRFRPGGVSRVRSAMIEMELDHETGAMRGTVLAGPDEGKSLDQMTRPECESVYRLCLRDDPEGARLLEAYLDRRFAGWRSAGQGDHNTRTRGSGRTRRAGVMSEDEAYEVLGLQNGASRDEVVRSHRSLMKKLHPDHGGSTDLAARVNEAKDVLMRRHQQNP